MMTVTQDYAALCNAIDDGDDSALPILADWLEEQGDRRAEWLRILIEDGKMPSRINSLDGMGNWETIYSWQFRQLEVSQDPRHYVGCYKGLCKTLLSRFSDQWATSHQSRSAAYLDIAQYLAECN